MDVNKLLDKCREVRSLHTDTALSLELGVSKQAVNDWRHGRKLPDEVSCARVRSKIYFQNNREKASEYQARNSDVRKARMENAGRISHIARRPETTNPASAGFISCTWSTEKT
jgi:hypothetical protein